MRFMPTQANLTRTTKQKNESYRTLAQKPIIKTYGCCARQSPARESFTWHSDLRSQRFSCKYLFNKSTENHKPAVFVLYPYLTIYMRELGITIEETAVMNSITPFVDIVMTPISGLYADKIGNLKLTLSLFSAFGGVATLLLLLIPVARTNVEYPSSIVLATEGCGSVRNFVYGAHQNYPCDTISATKTELTLKSCGYSCPLGSLNDSYVKDILASRSYKLNVYNVKSQSNVSYDYIISDSNMPEKPHISPDLRETRKLENIEHYEIAIRQLSSDTLFFPAHKPPLISFVCDAGQNSTACAFKSVLGDELEPASSVRFNASLKSIAPTDLDETSKIRRYSAEGVERALDKNNDDYESGAPVDVEIALIDATVKLEDCSRSCLFTAPRKDVCSNAKFIVEHDAKFTFWTYLAVSVFIGVIGSLASPMFEGAVIAILREQKADYGLQCIYGSVGAMIASPLSGLLVDYTSTGKGYIDLRPSFYLYAALKIFTSFLIMLMDLDFKVPATNVMSDVMTVLRNVEIVALLIAITVLGVAWGCVESFLFWFLEDLGASTSLMGMTVTISGIAEILLLVLSGPIIDKIGHANVIYGAFVCYAIKLLGYSLIYDPRLYLVLEAMESMTPSLTSTAAVTYASKLSSTTTDRTVQGLLGCLQYAVGSGCGSLIGGFMMKAFDIRPAFRIFAVATFLAGTIYFFVNLFYLSKRPQAGGSTEVDEQPQEIKEKSVEYKKDLAHDVVDDVEAMTNAKNLDNSKSVVVKEAATCGSVNAAFENDEEARSDEKT